MRKACEEGFVEHKTHYWGGRIQTIVYYLYTYFVIDRMGMSYRLTFGCGHFLLVQLTLCSEDMNDEYRLILDHGQFNFCVQFSWLNFCIFKRSICNELVSLLPSNTFRFEKIWMVLMTCVRSGINSKKFS